MLLTVVLALMAITNIGVSDINDVPKGAFRVPASIPASMNAPMAGNAAESFDITPLSEMKYGNMVHQAYDYSCGSASLTNLFNYYLGENLQESEVMEGMLKYGEKDKIVQRRGFSLLDMKRYSAIRGYKSAGFKATIADLEDLKQPGLVSIEYAGFKHFVVFREMRDGHVYIADPAQGKISFTVAKFQQLWDNGVLFLVYPKENADVNNRLELADDDLRVMDADRIRQIMISKLPEFTIPQEWKADQAAGGVIYYRH